MSEPTLTATIATGRNWCNWCPDLIVEGEVIATSPDLKDPFGGQGYAHADCATRNGYKVQGDAVSGDADVLLRRAFRGEVDSLTVELE